MKRARELHSSVKAGMLPSHQRVPATRFADNPSAPDPSDHHRPSAIGDDSRLFARISCKQNQMIGTFFFILQNISET